MQRMKRMKRIAVFVLSYFLFATSISSGALPGEAGPTETKRRTNVVLILADYMGYGDIGPYGVSDTRTPHLDRLAREGVKLTDFYGAAPICTPSRTAMLTGRYQQRARLEGNVGFEGQRGLSASEVTVARLLKNAGYATAVFGKWHLGFEPRFMPNAHGFDEFFGFLDWTVDYYSHRTYTGEPGLYENTKPVEEEGYMTDLLTERAVGFIDQHAADPFFLYVSYIGGLPPCQPPGHPEDVRTKETWDSSTRADYVQVVEAMDGGIGDILAALDRNQLTDDTLVIFTYDHGGRELSRKTPLFHGFATLWEGGIRVPCLLRWPGHLPAGKVSAQAAINMDLAASILAATAVSPSPNRPLDGINLIPILSGRKPVVERSFFWRIAYRVRVQKAVRRGKWKYVKDGTAHMLFDLERDIGERQDLVYKYPGVVSELKALLSGWEEEMEASEH